MKTLAALLFATALIAGCQSDSKLDQKSSGDLEARVKKLEETNAKYAEAFDFLQQAYDAQKKQQQAQEQAEERDTPAPDAVFAVDVAPDLAAGQVEGPATACVTLVEAWDFA